jgi:CspA family cold shock protein
MKKLFTFLLAAVLCCTLITLRVPAKTGGSPKLGEPNMRIPAMRWTGKVKFFNKGRGFGFITLHDGKDIYFNVSGLQKGIDPDRLVEGTGVEFDVVQTNKGAVATNIMIIEEIDEGIGDNDRGSARCCFANSA